MNESVYLRAQTRPCIPDQEGNLAVPTSLGLPPAGLPRQALEIWAACPGRPIDWCHPSLETRTRRLRVERLVLAGRRSASTVEEWLETLTKDASPQSSSSAVRAGAEIALGNDPLKRLEVERAKIVLTGDGRLVPPDPHRIFLPSDYISLTADLSIVHPALAADKEAIAALAAFGIKPADIRRELENLMARGYEIFRDPDWERFWMLANSAGPAAPNSDQDLWQYAPDKSTNSFRIVSPHDVHLIAWLNRARGWKQGLDDRHRQKLPCWHATSSHEVRCGGKSPGWAWLEQRGVVSRILDSSIGENTPDI